MEANSNAPKMDPTPYAPTIPLADALTGLVVWISQRPIIRRVDAGCYLDIAQLAEILKEFRESHGIGMVSDGWPETMVVDKWKPLGHPTALEKLKSDMRNKPYPPLGPGTTAPPAEKPFLGDLNDE
jgi:hypothetical protein